MNFLPAEILLSILSYLRSHTIIKLSRVSKRWYALCHDELMWRNRLRQEFPFELTTDYYFETYKLFRFARFARPPYTPDLPFSSQIPRLISDISSPIIPEFVLRVPMMYIRRVTNEKTPYFTYWFETLSCQFSITVKEGVYLVKCKIDKIPFNYYITSVSQVEPFIDFLHYLDLYRGLDGRSIKWLAATRHIVIK